MKLKKYDKTIKDLIYHKAKASVLNPTVIFSSLSSSTEGVMLPSTGAAATGVLPALQGPAAGSGSPGHTRRVRVFPCLEVLCHKI